MARMMSYAENQEDVLLNRLFPEGGDGFYIDVGANDPVSFSVTKHFYDRGWRGINVEPGVEDFGRLEALRQRDLNLNLGLSDRDGTLTFRESPDRPGWSSFEDQRADVFRHFAVDYRERTVPVTTLARVCETHGVGAIDFLKVDVEGHEAEVIGGADWGRWRPRAVVVEATTPERWEPRLKEADYLFAAFDGPNNYYLRAEDRDLLPRLAAPVSCLDQYVPYAYQFEIDRLTELLARRDAEDTPVRMLMAQLRSASRRHPRLAAVAKRLIRRAG